MADVTVIGGGIIGICSAIALQRDGHRVEIVEKDQPGGGATFGNCGLLATGEVVPISRPGLLAKAVKSLLDPLGPLFIRPRALASEAGWLLRFVRAGRPDRVRAIAHAAAALTRLAEHDYVELLERAGIADNLIRADNLMVFEDPAAPEKDALTWALKRELGFEHETLDREALQRLEPEIGGPIRLGILMRNWLHFSDPHLMARRLAAYFESLGGRLRIGEVRTIGVRGHRAETITLASGETLPVDTLVLAAGAWSGGLARQLGLRTPVTALTGYHIHAPQPGVSLGRAVLYGEGGFVLTPMETGLRIAGTVEIAGLNARPDFRRADVLAQRAKTILPGLDLTGARKWAGPRPFMPDTLPVLGRSPRQENVVLAYGHAQVGITLGPTTGRLVADIVAGRPPAVDLAPYAAERF